jgi:hypothetical protein
LRNLGNSKSRTKQQEEAGKRIILDLLNNQPSNSAVAFTDGSCSGNPGPCGSGAIIFHKEEEIELKRAVSNRGSILLFPSGDICLSGSSISFHTSNFLLIGMVFLYELILPNCLIAISSLLPIQQSHLQTARVAAILDPVDL